VIKRIAQVQSEDRVISQLQQNITASVNPILDNQLIDGVLLQGVNLSVGTTTVNHKLSRKLVGWFLTRKRALANVYDTQDSNSIPDRTLDLVSDAAVTVDIYCF
jgi:hypothetical protein